VAQQALTAFIPSLSYALRALARNQEGEGWVRIVVFLKALGNCGL